ncbi:heterokaryon incompatibility protein-domain-containing protein [Xylogone sp. PMI_703]|nr:heterokaryon incompatibility protein-domain-containing protein [Xylogone sp. PMI_703]
MESVIITGPRWNNPELHPLEPLRCAICEGRPPDPPGSLSGTREQGPQGHYGVTNNSTKLCSICKDWDDIVHVVFCLRDDYARIDPEIFSVGVPDIPGHFDREYDQGIPDLTFYTPDRWSSESCMLCRYVRNIISGEKENRSEIKAAIWRPFPFDDFPWLQIQRKDRFTRQENLSQRCIFPICISKHSEADRTATYRTVFLELVFHYEHYGYRLTRVSKWDRRYIDIKSIKKWLTHCKSHHGDLCSKPRIAATLPREFRLIDTSSRCIMQCKTSVQYVALSYTWALATGSPNKDIQLEQRTLGKLSRKNSLTADILPEVIVDAIKLCAGIGQQYLWVDRLCIMQDDNASKFDQIAAMDTIYQTATFTIFALANGVGSGLPGTSRRPREPTLDNESWRLIATTGGRYSFAALSPGLSYEIGSSTWNSRAWTYQEYQLSRRCLFIGGQHSYFSCQHESDSLDDSPYEARYWANQEEDSKVYQSPQILLQGKTQIWFPDYASTVEAYTARRLSIASDALHAFAGVGNAIATMWHTILLSGIPERFFVRALLWGYEGSRGRREVVGIPSWSWAAWDGAAKYDRIGGYDGGHNPIKFSYDSINMSSLGAIVYFYFKDSGTRTRPLNDTTMGWFRPVHWSGTAEKDNSLIPPWTGLSEQNAAEFWQKCAHNPQEALRHRNLPNSVHSILAEIATPCLVFNTTCANLYLSETGLTSNISVGHYYVTGDHGIQYTVIPKQPKAPNVPGPTRALITLDIIDERSNIIGHTTLMDKIWAHQAVNLKKKYLVVVLCAGVRDNLTAEFFKKPVAGRRGQYLPGEPWCLWVMIIEMEGSISRRLALGAVNPVAWTRLKPRWQTVVLA